MSRRSPPSFASRSEKLRDLGVSVLAGAVMLGIAAPLIQFTSPAPAVAVVDAVIDAAGSAQASTSPSETAPPQASADVRYLVHWIAATGNNAGLEFLVVDKKNGAAHVFNAKHQWRASTPVLVGSALGDDTVPGIGTRPLSMVKPHERTTPAGRFVAELGTNAHGEAVVWVDYDAAVSMHSVRTTNASEQRLQRLASADIGRRRISYGCINFPDAFFKTRVLPTFVHQKALVYVLPDIKSIDSVFGSSTPRAAARALLVAFKS